MTASLTSRPAPGPAAPRPETFSERLETAVYRRLMTLPRSVVRRLAGAPIVVEGNTLSLPTQWQLTLQRLTQKPIETLPLPQARAALVRQARTVGGRQPIGSVRHLTVDGAEGPLDARLYTPRALIGATAPAPLLVFFHGGGMIYGDLDSHDAVCRFLAEQAGVLVLAVDYRLAPEAVFPAGHDDAVAAYRWVVANVDALGADRDRLAVGGDSAGGYLSAATAIVAARDGLPLAFQLLIYPMTDFSGSMASRRTFGAGFFLTTGFMDLASTTYGAGCDPDDPRVSVLRADLPQGLAPAFVVTAGFDPLRDEGEAYAAKLAEAGVPVQAERYPGEIHGFANDLGLDGPARRAMVHVAGMLRRALHP